MWRYASFDTKDTVRLEASTLEVALLTGDVEGGRRMRGRPRRRRQDDISATYQICFRLPIPNLNPNPNPNLNPKINQKQNDTRMKLNIELYLKVDFLGTGVGL